MKYKNTTLNRGQFNKIVKLWGGGTTIAGETRSESKYNSKTGEKITWEFTYPVGGYGNLLPKTISNLLK